VAGKASSLQKPEWWGAGVLISLERGADLNMAQLMPCHSLSLASVKSRLVLPFWYRLSRVVLDKGPLNGCVCVLIFFLFHYYSVKIFMEDIELCFGIFREFIHGR